MIPVFLAGWAHRHNISATALAELAQLMGAETQEPPTVTGAPGSEAYTQSQVRLEAARAGVHLWRNNVGAMEDETGRFVRFGLANDSPALNARLKSADLVGWRPVAIGPGHVGTIIAQFVSRECKAASWRYTGTPREVAQAAWATLINSHGGDARFATGPGTL